MVDALASGASTRKGVEVRVLSWAPNTSNKYLIVMDFADRSQRIVLTDIQETA